MGAQTLKCTAAETVNAIVFSENCVVDFMVSCINVTESCVKIETCTYNRCEIYFIKKC